MTFGVIWVVAVVAGFVGAISGMGGGVVLIPALTFLGIDIKHAIAMSVLSMLVISNTAASYYVKRHMPNLRVSGFLEVYAVIGAIVGSLITLVLAQQLLFFLCGLLFLSFSAILWQRQQQPQQPTHSQDPYSHMLGWSGSYYDEAERRTIAYQGRRAAWAGPLAGGAAVVSGFLGIGGSAFVVLINDVVIGLPQKVSLTTSHLIIGVIALASADVYLENGFIDAYMTAPVILGVTCGALVGAKFVTKLTNQRTRTLFICVLTILGIELLINGLRGRP